MLAGGTSARRIRGTAIPAARWRGCNPTLDGPGAWLEPARVDDPRLYWSCLVALCLVPVACRRSSGASSAVELPQRAEIVAFPSGKLTLRGLLLRPEGSGPFPVLLVFAKHGWAFFMPYRRGQGLSQTAGAAERLRLRNPPSVARSPG